MCSCKKTSSRQPSAVKQIVKSVPVRSNNPTQSTPKKTAPRRVVVRRPI